MNGSQAIIKVNGKSISVSTIEVEFSDSAEKANRQGTQYVLKDRKFMTIGFLDSSPIYLNKYVIPKKLKDLKTEINEEKDSFSFRRSNMIMGWIHR